MIDTVVISSEENSSDTVEEIDEAVEELQETVDEAVEELTDIIEENEDKLSWLVNSVSIMQEQVQNLSEAVTTMATLLIPLPSPEPMEAETLEIVEPMTDISETPLETSNTLLQEDLESAANPAPILEQETRKIIKI